LKLLPDIAAEALNDLVAVGVICWAHYREGPRSWVPHAAKAARLPVPRSSKLKPRENRLPPSKSAKHKPAIGSSRLFAASHIDIFIDMSAFRTARLTMLPCTLLCFIEHRL